MGVPHIGTKGFGLNSVSSLSLVPRPPHKSTTLILFNENPVEI